MNADTLLTEADGGNSNSGCGKKLTEKYKDTSRPDAHMKDKKDGGEPVCYKCLHGGLLFCCCGKGCQRRYHPSCLDPPLNYIPMGFWHCAWCVKKKLDLGVHDISEGVEAILDSREVVSENKVMEREYFVKYQGLAHAHNRWVIETQMLLEAPKLLAKFKKKRQVTRWKRDWSVPHRMLLKREIVLPKQKQNGEHFDGHDNNDYSIGRYEWLVKWTGLGYDHVTWELDDASFMTSSEGMNLMKDYESRRKRTDRLSNPFEANEERKASFAELSLFPSGDSLGSYNQHLSYVNKLRLFWHKGQSAFIVDDKIDQERVMKVILFVLSLQCDVTRPFLIISTSTALSVWEREFLHLAPSANLVVYKGNKDVRSSIRALEFYNDNGGILFQILLSSSDVIIEDLNELRCIPWEAIVIDECQRSRILEHLDNIKVLAAEMRLLLVSGQIKEDRADYIKLLSFLKSGHHLLNIAETDTYFSDSISDLKSELEQYVAFKCSAGSTRFSEYWVPAQLSSLQFEQYCSMLLSNSMLLCSPQKTDKVDALHDLIESTRKCCNHPYLLDQSLHNSVNKGLPVEEYLNTDIRASGKLQLLEKILLEAKSRGLRVVILFQSTGGLRTIGDILDDVLCHRFGNECYVRYARGYIPSKKQDALDKFNDKESGTFVFLMESRACLPSVKLSSVDAVILFDSDWDPQNDLRALQRMSISSQFEQLTVFRLYSSFTVEEKVLMLAKEGVTLESNVQLINQSTCHSLLRWGASYLFNKLDELHGCGTLVFAPDIISGQTLLSYVICELSTLLVCGSRDIDQHGWSFIASVQQTGGEYARNILLLGERVSTKLDNGLNDFSWSNLLEGRRPRWKFLAVSSQRIRKTINHFDHILKESECENDAIMRKRSKVSEDNADPKRRKVSKDNVDPKRKNLSKDNVDPKRKVLKDNMDAKRSNLSSDTVDAKRGKMSNHVVNLKARKVSKDIDGKRREESKDIADSKYLEKGSKNKKKQRNVYQASKMTGKTDDFSKKPIDMPQSTEFLQKPDLAGLCDVLHLPKNVKAVGMWILEHIFEYYNVNCEEASTMHAFEISVCWLAASLLKHKIDKKGSLSLAKMYLNFDCEGEEVTYVYSTLRKFKNNFSTCLQNGLHVEKCIPDCNPPGMKALVEEKQKGFQGPHVSDFVESDTNGHDIQRKSPTTVLSAHDQTYAEKFHIRFSANENCPSQQRSGSLPVEADAIIVESDAEDDRLNAMTSSIDLHNVNPATGYFERQINGIVSEDSQINANEIVAGDIDNSMNMSSHPVQLNGVETNTVTCNTAAVFEVSQSFSVAPVCGESTISDFAEATLPFMQPSNANPGSSHQEAMLAIPSFSQNSSGISNLPEAEVIFQASNNPVEPDPLQIEMERIKKETEEASKIREQKLLQLESEYQKEVEKLGEKYGKLFQNANTATELKKKELETSYEIVLKNQLLAEAWIQNIDICKSDAVQRTEEVAIPSSSNTHVGSPHTPLMPAQRLEQCMEVMEHRPIFNPPLCTNPMEMANTSTPIPEISLDESWINPVIQYYINIHDYYDSLSPYPDG